MSISNEHTKRSLPERIGMAVLLGWIIFCAAMKTDSLPGFIQDLFFKQPDNAVVLRSGGAPDPTAPCELDAGVGNYGVLTNLYQHLLQHFGPNQAPGTWLYLPDPIVQTRALPYAVRELEWEEPDGTFTEVLIFSRGSKGRGVLIPLDTWPEGYPFGTGRFHDVGLTDSGALFFGANKLHLKYEPGMAFPVDNTPSDCIAPLFSGLEVVDGVSRVLWKLDAKAFTVVCSNLVHSGTGVAVSFACVLERGGGFRFQYVDVPPNVLAQSIGGVQFMQHGIPLFGPGHNPCGVTNGVEVVFKHITEEMAATKTVGEVTLLEVLLYHLTEGRSFAGMAPYKWLLENNFCCHADISQEQTPGGVSIETAWQHFINPHSAGPSSGSMTYTQLIAAGLDPNGGPTPNVTGYPLAVTFYGGSGEAGTAFIFYSTDAQKDARQQRFFCPANTSVTIPGLHSYWGNRYLLQVVSGSGHVELDASRPMAIFDCDEIIPHQAKAGPMMAPMMAMSAGSGWCLHHSLFPALVKGRIIHYGQCYDPKEEEEFWPPWLGHLIVYGQLHWYEKTEQQWGIIHPLSPLLHFENGVYIAPCCGCPLDVHPDQGFSVTPYAKLMTSHLETDCGCIKSRLAYYYWHNPKIKLHAPACLCAQVRRANGKFDEAEMSVEILGWHPDMADKFEVEVVGWRKGFHRIGVAPPYTYEWVTQSNIVTLAYNETRIPATNSVLHLTWNGRADKGYEFLEDVELPHSYGGEPIRRYLYDLTAGEPVVGHHIHFTARLIRKAHDNIPDDIYDEDTVTMNFKQVVMDRVEQSAIEELGELQDGRPHMLTIGLTNMPPFEAMVFLRNAITHSRNLTLSALDDVLVGPDAYHLLEFVDETDEVIGPYKQVIYTGRQGMPEEIMIPLDAVGLSIGHAGTDDDRTPYFASGTNYVLITDILTRMNNKVITLPLPRTNLGELSFITGGSGSHEFGHDSGLVYATFCKILDGKPVLLEKGHYRFDDGLDKLRLIMNYSKSTPFEVHLGREGKQTWSAYDKLHLQRQYTP